MGAALAAPLIPIPVISCLANYQGTSLRNPFFFLLVDSFLESSVPCASPVFAASVAGAVPAAVESPFASPAAGAASLFAGELFAASSLAAALELAGAAAVGAVVAGVSTVPASFGCSPVAGGVATASEPAGATLSELLVAESAVPACPGTTTPTSAVPAAPPPAVCFPPGVNKSPPPDNDSDSGCICGVPCCADASSSPVGPLLIKSNGFLYRGVCGLGVFCSAVIQASAVGSGCGTGTPAAFSLSLACGASADNG